MHPADPFAQAEPGGRVLIVTDRSESWAALACALDARGHSVRVVSHQSARLELSGGVPADVAIIDVAASAWSRAVDLVEAVSRATEVVTATAPPTSAVEGLGVEHLVSPVHIDDMVEVLHRAVWRSRSTRALRASARMLEAMVDASPLATWVVGVDGAVRMWNAAAERLFGWRPDEVIGRATPVALPAIETGSHALGEPTPWHVEERRKDGSVVDVSVSTAPLRDEGHRIIGVIAYATDVSARRALEQQLRHAQKVATVAALAVGIVHDFNNLLTVIGGRSLLAATSIDVEDPRRRNLDLIAHTVERAAGLTRQLLALTRKQAPEPRVLDVGAIVRDMRTMLRRVIGDDVDLQMAVGEGSWRVRADPSQVEQVILNLVVNARDAMPEGGRLVIAVDDAAADISDVRGHAEAPGAGYVVLAVTDTGHGMDAATLGQVFDPFFTTKAPGQGTGLGLATVHAIVRDSGGHVRVSSAIGRGTRVAVYLPKVDEPAPLSARTPDIPRHGTETILLVEDDDEVRAVVRDSLQRFGYRVIEAAHAEAAMALEAEHAGAPIDLLVADVVMPTLSGPIRATRLRAQRPDMKVLFISGHATATWDGDAAFLQKPFWPWQLAGTVREILDAE